MKRHLINASVLLIAALSFAAPTLLSIQIAKTEAIASETARVMDYARDVVDRSDRTARQVILSLAQLSDMDTLPCSPASLGLMRRLAFSYSEVEAVGHVTAGGLDCSGLGRHQPPLALPPPDFGTENDELVRQNVELPQAPGQRFILVEHNGYIAFVHQQMSISSTSHDSNVSLVTFTPGAIQVRASSGTFRQEWLTALGEQRETSFIDGGYLVAIFRSDTFPTAALAAIPVPALSPQISRITQRLVPVGILAGCILAFAVFWLAQQQTAMPAMLRSALKRNEFFLLYQPIVDLNTGRWVGAEALLRWDHGNGEQIRPDIFIPCAEDNGLIQRITERVIRLANQDSDDLFRQAPDFHLSLNLSAGDIHDDKTVTLLEQLCAGTDARCGNLTVEVTERGLLNPHTAREVLHRIRKLGIRVALDDFGTGYSSLAYLESFELDYLKIDKAFVDTMGTDAATSQVAVHIIQMANALQLEMIAEGVETEEQAIELRNRGVQYAQGWLFGKPMPMRDLRRELALQRETSVAKDSRPIPAQLV